MAKANLVKDGIIVGTVERLTSFSVNAFPIITFDNISKTLYSFLWHSSYSNLILFMRVLLCV